MSDEYFETALTKYEGFVKPHTKGALFYHEIYDRLYPKQYVIMPFYWLPNWVGDVKDLSVRTWIFTKNWLKVSKKLIFIYN
jgi:hypothetical protein